MHRQNRSQRGLHAPLHHQASDLSTLLMLQYLAVRESSLCSIGWHIRLRFPGVLVRLTISVIGIEQSWNNSTRRIVAYQI
jgi:hypothetical protein